MCSVIPARDPRTLEPAGYYFLLFANPAYARAYQGHVLHLHRVARTYTPTSIESPLPVERGVVIEGEDAYTVLQDYALCPPSQNMQLKFLHPRHNSRTTRLLEMRGYRQLVEGNNKTGRSVLFKVDGQQSTTSMVRNIVATDGRERGLGWNVVIEKVDVVAEEMEWEERYDASFDNLDHNTGTELRPQNAATLRWILSFPDVHEARSFIRAWHRRPFPTARSDGPWLAHAELLW